MIKWETLLEIAPQSLRYRSGEILGSTFEVELTNGEKIQVWRATNGQQYFCHGLTFGGKDAPGGFASPYGKEVATILRGYYQQVPEAQAQTGDALVWWDWGSHTAVHSALLTSAAFVEHGWHLDYATRLQSKNGILPEAQVTLEELVLEYGESYQVYRQK